jgi:predicted GNAT family N-acyltransferase
MITTPIIRICSTEAERAEAMRIRFAVFVEEQRVPRELEVDEFDVMAVHLLAVEEETGNPIGTARFLDKGEGVAKIGRVAVLPDYRGKGVGEALMRAALERARRTGHAVVVLDAQLSVIGFYERLGFVAEGAVFDDAGIPHRRMSLRLDRNAA